MVLALVQSTIDRKLGELRAEFGPGYPRVWAYLWVQGGTVELHVTFALQADAATKWRRFPVRPDQR